METWLPKDYKLNPRASSMRVPLQGKKFHALYSDEFTIFVNDGGDIWFQPNTLKDPDPSVYPLGAYDFKPEAKNDQPDGFMVGRREWPLFIMLLQIVNDPKTKENNLGGVLEQSWLMNNKPLTEEIAKMMKHLSAFHPDLIERHKCQSVLNESSRPQLLPTVLGLPKAFGPALTAGLVLAPVPHFMTGSALRLSSVNEIFCRLEARNKINRFSGLEAFTLKQERLGNDFESNLNALRQLTSEGSKYRRPIELEKVSPESFITQLKSTALKSDAFKVHAMGDTVECTGPRFGPKSNVNHDPLLVSILTDPITIYPATGLEANINMGLRNQGLSVPGLTQGTFDVSLPDIVNPTVTTHEQLHEERVNAFVNNIDVYLDTFALSSPYSDPYVEHAGLNEEVVMETMTQRSINLEHIRPSTNRPKKQSIQNTIELF